ncbi:cbb3-type cytochrome c oxidase subunit I [Halobacillus halophilus]|uniref:cbb3-type cytochrome c oxidase subunit I n=1 Tax=Halobacillus halophilus TaxID=1570 RepID=UPI001CD71F19|nr:cbb3-type cytochrome c oxidase subunit I [Halobacillus halophilus]MCA1010817.1 cbb3-type cytochrome c oxidase subunit I [Halobacillus halophilus]
MGKTLIKISTIYFVLGTLMGYYMSIVHNYDLTPVHVHINLLGWTALTLAGILYHLFPQLAASKLGKIHFWLHNIGLPLMMAGLFLMIAFQLESLTAVIAGGATLTTTGILMFALNVWMHLKEEDAV